MQTLDCVRFYRCLKPKPGKQHANLPPDPLQGEWQEVVPVDHCGQAGHPVAKRTQALRLVETLCALIWSTLPASQTSQQRPWHPTLTR